MNMDILNWLMNNVLAILIAAGGAIAWINERKKRKADVKSVEVNNRQGEATAMTGMQAVYDTLVEDVKIQFAELRLESKNLKDQIAEDNANYLKSQKEISELRNKLSDAEKEISELRKQLSGAETERVELTNKVHDLEAQNANLKSELEKYQKELKLYRKENKK